MLKIKSIRDEGPRRLFEIHTAGSPAAAEALGGVARIARRLVEENELPGAFEVLSEGTLALELEPDRRSFFHDGIVFAALDAVNDPVKSPTLNRLELDLPPE
ncbi:MAG: hypothetical protein LC796_17260 [Acidobacteria bacterium]|nr:hypothetical protein [Acidobacteriota bacterium]